jgi:aspartate/glutamate racemase
MDPIMAKLAIIHTTLATTTSLPALASEVLPGISVFNFVDDTILPQLIKNGGKLSDVEDRVIQYARYAEQAGADVILCACSSIGEIVLNAQQHLHIPFLRIDEPMAEFAVQYAISSIGVAATLETTLGPTSRLVSQKAKEIYKHIHLTPMLIEGAYQKLTTGDGAGHDELLVAKLTELAQKTDVVVLAQASMARVLNCLPAHLSTRFLTSPQMGLEKVREVIGAL